jgi:hypothetical protein
MSSAVHDTWLAHFRHLRDSATPALDRLRALARHDGGKSAPKHIIICALLHAYTVSKNKQ